MGCNARWRALISEYTPRGGGVKNFFESEAGTTNPDTLTQKIGALFQGEREAAADQVADGLVIGLAEISKLSSRVMRGLAISASLTLVISTLPHSDGHDRYGSETTRRAEAKTDRR